MMRQGTDSTRTVSRRASRIAVLLAVGLAASGCQSSDPFVRWDDPVLERRIAEVRDGGLEAESRRVVANAEITEGSLEELIGLALANNPEVAAGRLKVERLNERPAQLSALDDPMLSLTVGELAETAAGQVDYIVALTQALPYPGTLDARASVAEQEVLTASAELLERIERVAGEVRRVYWRRYAVARAIEVTEQDREVLSQISGIIDARARVGEAEQADQLRVSLRTADLDQRLDRLYQEMRSLDAMLNRLLNRSTSAALPVPDAVDWQAVEVVRDRLIEAAEQDNPAVYVQRRRVEAFRHRFKLAQAERRPDFRIGVQYAAVGSDGLAGSANGEDQFAVTGSMSLPFWSPRYDAMEREALRGIGEALAELDAAQGRAANLAEDALARMEAERSILTRLNEQMLPDSRRAFELAMTGYGAGTVSFIQMMDDWQRTLDLELAAHRAHARYEQARADLAAALGEVSGRLTESQTNETKESDHE
jgi:outer membrane protein TolC